MFADRGAIWAKVEILRRSIAGQGMPQENTNQFGRAADFSLLEPANADAFRKECEAALQLPLAPAISELFRQAHDANMDIVLVEMPMRQAHRAQFYETKWWTEYTSPSSRAVAALQTLLLWTPAIGPRMTRSSPIRCIFRHLLRSCLVNA